MNFLRAIEVSRRHSPMTDLRTPEIIDPDGVIREDELVAADAAIIGKAFLWSLLVFVVIGFFLC